MRSKKLFTLSNCTTFEKKNTLWVEGGTTHFAAVLILNNDLETWIKDAIKLCVSEWDVKMLDFLVIFKTCLFSNILVSS